MAFCSAILALSGLPYRDPVLLSIDTWIFGFGRNAFVAAIAGSPTLMRATIWIYDSLAITPPLLLLLLLTTGRTRTAWIVLTALTITVAVAVCTLPLVPAVGTPPYAYRFVDVFNGLRSGTLRRLDGSLVTGLVTFPSVHAADAVILAWGFGKFGRWGFPLVLLNGAMIMSAIVVEGHYMVDVVAGGMVAAAAIPLATIAVDALAARDRATSTVGAG